MPDEKIKFLMRIDPATDRKIKAAMPLANCRSQNEFVEKALQFYCDYVASQDCFSVLPPMLIAALRATVQGSENHICRLLFKLAVEMDMMMNVLGRGHGDPGGTAERTAGALYPGGEEDPRHDLSG